MYNYTVVINPRHTCAGGYGLVLCICVCMYIACVYVHVCVCVCYDSSVNIVRFYISSKVHVCAAFVLAFLDYKLVDFR